jgi:hypothetical protein
MNTEALVMSQFIVSFFQIFLAAANIWTMLVQVLLRIVRCKSTENGTNYTGFGTAVECGKAKVFVDIAN